MLALGGSVLAVAGVLCVFVAWRRRDLRPAILPAGWALAALGLVAWMAAMRPDTGLARASLVVMCAALAIIAGQGVLSLRAARKVRAVPIRADESDGLVLGRGYWGRVAVRAVGSLAVVPAVAAAAALLWYGAIHVSDADRIMGAAFVCMFAAAAALMWLLASRRPWRTCAVLAAAGAAMALLAVIA